MSALRLFSILSALLLFTGSASAQWVTENYTLKAGWNAIWLPLDCTHAEIAQVLPDARIEEVWRWNPPVSSTQYVASPSTPIAGDVQWSTWVRATPIAPFTTFFALSGNSAYLVKVADSVTETIAIGIKGRPLPPRYPWKESGANLFGFPMASGDTTFAQFYGYNPGFTTLPPTYYYLGGAGQAPTPRRQGALSAFTMTRGEAYWVHSFAYTDYYGPVKITAGLGALNFGTEGYVSTIRIKNPTKTALTVTLASVASEAPPAGAPPLPALQRSVPLQVRGQFDPGTGQFAYAPLPQAIALAPGEEQEVVFSVRRAEMGSTAGQEFQSVVRVTDSLGITQIDLPARAVTTSLAGLWTGTAVIETVDQVVGATHTPKPAPSTYQVRVLLHMNDSGQTTLLQQAYLGPNTSGAQVLSARQAGLDQTRLASAARLSTASFPLDLRVPNGGSLGLTGAIGFNVQLPADAATNPFLHVYHPDHSAAKSFPIQRAVTFTFSATVGGTDPTFGSTTLGGLYSESITGLRAGTALRISGPFFLRRLSTIPTLIP